VFSFGIAVDLDKGADEGGTGADEGGIGAPVCNNVWDIMIDIPATATVTAMITHRLHVGL